MFSNGKYSQCQEESKVERFEKFYDPKNDSARKWEEKSQADKYHFDEAQKKQRDFKM